MSISLQLPVRRKQKRSLDEPTEELHPETEESKILETEFKQNMSFTVIYSVIAGLTTPYTAASSINSKFTFLWNFLVMSDEDIQDTCTTFSVE